MRAPSGRCSYFQAFPLQQRLFRHKLQLFPFWCRCSIPPSVDSVPAITPCRPPPPLSSVKHPAGVMPLATYPDPVGSTLSPAKLLLFSCPLFFFTQSLFFYQPLAGWPSHGPHTPTPTPCEWNAFFLCPRSSHPVSMSLHDGYNLLDSNPPRQSPQLTCQCPRAWSMGRPLL